MNVGTIADPVVTLEKATGELQQIATTTETQIRLVAQTFKELAEQADVILSLAAALVGCVENEGVSSVLQKVQDLGTAARQFIGEGLQATTGILEAVATEVEVLRQLSQITAQQAKIAVKTKALSVLTSIEVAHLGERGAGFRYLARELADFSRSLIEDARTLESRTDARKAAIMETKRVLSIEFPRLREKLAVIEVNLGKDLANLHSSLIQLSSTPAQFKMGVENIAQQIAGVVSAIQAHDITRQQSEHVEEAFAIISARIRDAESSNNGNAKDYAHAYAGLTIQIYQLKSIKVTVEAWTMQIKTCMDGILRVSVSEMVGIGPMVLAQERGVASQLAHIESLERESQSYAARMQHALDGLSSLMKFVGEHAQRSKSVRDRLRLLSFNSIIEASHLGAKAKAVLAIAKSIKEISAEWSQITDQSARAMEEMLALTNHTNAMMEVFSEFRNEKLRDAQFQTRTGLENLRAAATFAAKQSQEMEVVTEKMRAKSVEVGGTDDLLDSCSGKIEQVLNQLEFLRDGLEHEHPGVRRRYDEMDVGRLYSASYTTEIEREIMRAALRGAPLPAQQTLAGNSVELF